MSEALSSPTSTPSSWEMYYKSITASRGLRRVGALRSFGVLGGAFDAGLLGRLQPERT